MSEHVYEGAPDARQSAEPIQPTRFRPRFRPLTAAEKQLHDEIKAQAEVLERLFNKTSMGGRYLSLAITDLESAVMWAVKELTK